MRHVFRFAEMSVILHLHHVHLAVRMKSRFVTNNSVHKCTETFPAIRGMSITNMKYAVRKWKPVHFSGCHVESMDVRVV